MDFSISAEQRMLREHIVRFARGELNEDVIGRDGDQRFSRELWEKCGAMGLQGLPIPEEYGGGGFDTVTTALALEALGYGCTDGGLVFSLCAHMLSCAVPIWKHGTEEQKQRLLPGLCGGSIVGGNATTEPESGSDAFAMRTRAVQDGSGWRISGTKMFTSNGPVADLLIVYAVTHPDRGFHGGITAFLVERGAEGLHTGGKIGKLGLRTSPLGEVVLDDVRVGAGAVLGSVGAGGPIFTESMDWERVLLFSSHVGTMERLVEQGIAYARGRTQFGQAIGKFQAVSHRLADAHVRVETARLLTRHAAFQLGRSRTASRDAAMAKLYVSEAFVATALDVLQVYGGYGYTTEYEIERVLRDAVGSRIYSGTSEMQRSIIARWLGL